MEEFYLIYPKRLKIFQVKYLIGELLIHIRKGVNFQNNDNRVIIRQYFSVINCNENMVNDKKKKGKRNLPWIYSDIKQVIPFYDCRSEVPWGFYTGLICQSNKKELNKVLMFCDNGRRTFFLHTLSSECTSKMCITFLGLFLVYFHL